MTNEKLVAIDFETYYDKKEYSLSNMSAFMYVHDGRFDAYLVSVYDGQGLSYVGRPEEFDWALLDGCVPCAHNASFDQQVYDRLVELGAIRAARFVGAWVCTADMVAYLGCKRDLKTAAKYMLDIEVSKAARAAAAGRTGDELAESEQMREYALGDALYCYMLAEKYLSKWPADERRMSELNRESAIRGFPLNLDLVEKGIATLAPELDAALAQIPWAWDENNERTEVKPLSPNALKSHCESLGIPAPASTAKTSVDFQNWIDERGEEFPFAKAMGQYRSINTLHNRVSNLKSGFDPATGRFPYEKKYFGAATGRFSGGGESGMKFNMENMPRTVMYGVDVRPMFVSSPGTVLLIADYAQVEARYLLWLVGDEAKLEPCRRGASVYQAYAEMVGDCEPGDDIKRSNPKLYSYEKARVLGLGYFSGAAKFVAFAAGYGITLTPDEAQEEVDRYRALNPKVVGWWYQHQDWLKFSARRRDDTHQVELRNGRILTYYQPRGDGREIMAAKTMGGPRMFVHGGVLTENEVQASCRDILKDAWVKLDKEWGHNPVLLSVHDELVVEVPENEAADRAVDLRRVMTTCSPWTEGLPLDVEVGVSNVYMK